MIAKPNPFFSRTVVYQVLVFHMVNIEQWLRGLPPVTQLLILGTVGTTALFPLVHQLVLFFPLGASVVGEWLFLAPISLLLRSGASFNLGLIFHVIMLAQCSSQLERDVFQQWLPLTFPVPRELYYYSAEDAALHPTNTPIQLVNSLRYIWFIVVSSLIFYVERSCWFVLWHFHRFPLRTIISPFSHFPNGSFPMMCLWVWCRLQPQDRRLAFPFFNFPVRARYYPIVLALFHFITGQSLVDDVVAALAAHTFVYLAFLRRRRFEAVFRKFFEVPAWVYYWMRERRKRKFDELRAQGLPLPRS